MTDNREELKRQLAETRAQMERLEAELEQAEQWEPEGGRYWIMSEGIVNSGGGGTYDSMRNFGVERPTREQAERARDLMRVHNRALAYVQEHAPDRDGSGAWCVCKGNVEWIFYRDHRPSLGGICGPRHVMEQLAADLNSGRVKL